MTYFQAIFLAVVQGLTEFLPVSSSGHLVIFQKVFGLEPPILFDVLVHVGTLGSVLIFFKARLAQIISGLVQRKKESIKLLQLVIIGSIPAVIVGLLLQRYLDQIFDSLELVGISLLLTAAFLFFTRWFKYLSSEGLSGIGAFFIGLFQALAILPGVSRSGSTISAGLWQGLGREKAFEFSFLLAVPAIIGALTLEIPALVSSSTGYLVQGVLGMVVAGMVGCFSLKILKKALLSDKFWLFGIYCLVLGLVILVV